VTWLLPPLPPNWEAALRDVHAQGLHARLAAAERLGRASPEQTQAALDGLNVLVHDKDARVRGAALRALTELGDVRTAQPLLAALQDPDEQARELALLGVAQLPAEIALEPLLAATSSGHPELRFQAIGALTTIAPERAVGHIERLVRDVDARVRAAAVQAAAELDLAHPELAASLHAALAAALNDPDRRVRGEAALLFARRGDGRAADALRGALEDPELVLPALDAAPKLDDARLRERIQALALKLLGPRLVVAAAARALLRMNDARGIDTLRAVLRAWRGDGRTFAVETAGELCLWPLLPELIELAGRPRGSDRLVLVKALGRFAASGAGQSPDALTARAALQKLALRDDEAGAQSHAELSRLSPPTGPDSSKP
jgi:HEAT repeat protein